MTENEVIDSRIKELKEKRNIISSEIISLSIKKNNNQTVMLSSLWNSIVDMVGDIFDVVTWDIVEWWRKRDVGTAKKMVMHLMRKYCWYTYEHIWRILWWVTHWTIVYWHKQAKILLIHNHDFKWKAAILEKQIEFVIDSIWKNDQ